MTAAALPRPRPAHERDRPAVHAHGERKERERPPFRRIAILASVPGLSRPH